MQDKTINLPAIEARITPYDRAVAQVQKSHREAIERRHAYLAEKISRGENDADQK
jgi:hypothetical protein